MNKQNNFQKNWAQFVNETDLNSIEPKDLARTFFELGYCCGVME
jgi:hypothetical protein